MNSIRIRSTLTVAHHHHHNHTHTQGREVDNGALRFVRGEEERKSSIGEETQ